RFLPRRPDLNIPLKTPVFEDFDAYPRLPAHCRGPRAPLPPPRNQHDPTPLRMSDRPEALLGRIELECGLGLVLGHRLKQNPSVTHRDHTVCLHGVSFEAFWYAKPLPDRAIQLEQIIGGRKP